ALKKLGEEYPAGAANLKDGLPQVIKSFNGKADRQRVLVFMGSGESIAGPVDAELRASLCKEMVNNQVAFFSIPLGAHMQPYNLHGFAKGTGGTVVRRAGGDSNEQWLANLLTSVAQPILYDSEIKLPAEVVES